MSADANDLYKQRDTVITTGLNQSVSQVQLYVTITAYNTIHLYFTSTEKRLATEQTNTLVYTHANYFDSQRAAAPNPYHFSETT